MTYRGHNELIFSDILTTYWVHYREDMCVEKPYRRSPKVKELRDFNSGKLKKKR